VDQDALREHRCMPAQAGVCDTFRGDVPSDRSWGFGVRKTTLGRGNRVALPAITLVRLYDPWDRPSAISSMKRSCRSRPIWVTGPAREHLDA